jgi:2-oxo-3-hexenedioate decarboxylase
MDDPHTLARELADAYASRRSVPPPSARDPRFDLDAAYAVEAELTRIRGAGGHAPVGRKVGYASKAMWRALKLETLVWAHMYDDTVRHAGRGTPSLDIGRMCSPKIEPEVVFKLKTPIDPATADPSSVLEAVEWLALGFEIVDCVFPDWTFTPPDFVAAYGLHAALVVGEPAPVRPEAIAGLVDALAAFTVKLLEGGRLVAEGSGRNSLRSPALCLAELACAIARRPGAEPLGPGELVSSGTLTDARPILPGETWTAVVDGLALEPLELTLA